MLTAVTAVAAATTSLCLLTGGVASADTVVGVYVPSEPFPDSSRRLELANRLANHLGAALGENGVGKAFVRAGDLAGAIKRGDITVAVVDPSYFASASTANVLAQAVRGSESTHAWQLVCKTDGTLLAQRGKRLLIPTQNGRERDVVVQGLLRGEVPNDFFAAVDAATDTASAVAAVGLGKSDCAVVPADATGASSLKRVATLGSLPGPFLISTGALSPEQKVKITEAAVSFRGDEVIAGFRAATSDTAAGWSRRLAPTVRRGPMAVPATRLLVTELIGERSLAIAPPPLSTWLAPVATPPEAATTSQNSERDASNGTARPRGK